MSSLREAAATFFQTLDRLGGLRSHNLQSGR